MEVPVCLLCELPLENDQVIIKTKQELSELRNISERRGDQKFSSLDVEGELLDIVLHNRCRNAYSDEECVPNSVHDYVEGEQEFKDEPDLADSLDSKTASTQHKLFDYENLCIICGTDASAGFLKKEQKKKMELRARICFIKKPSTAQTLIDFSYKSDEKFREEVRDRIKEQDLVALNARYHQKCYERFSYVYIPTGRKRGRAKAMVEDALPDPQDEYYKDYIANEDREFNYQAQCIICGRNASDQPPIDGAGSSIRLIQQHDTGDNLLTISFKYEDKWRKQVRGRVQGKDLVSLSARYHTACFPQYFSYKRRILCVSEGDSTSYYLEGSQDEDIFNDLFEDILIDYERQDDLPIQEIIDCTHNTLPSISEAEHTIASNAHINCFLCGEDASDTFIKEQMENPSHKRIHVVLVNKQSTVDKLRKVVANCDDDCIVESMASIRQVRTRLQGNHLNAAGLRYHKSCLCLFIEKICKNLCETVHEKYNSGESLQDWHDVIDDENRTAQDRLKISENLLDINKDHRNEDTIEDLSETFNDGSLEDTTQDNHETEDDPDAVEDSHEDVVENKPKVPVSSQVQTRRKVKFLYEKLSSQYCNACLSSGRRLYLLVQYACVFTAVCGKRGRKRIYVCWECLGVLRKIKEFKDRVEKARERLNGMQQLEVSKLPCLSTLAEIKMCNIDLYCHTDTQNSTYPRIQSEGYSKRHFIHIETEQKNITRNQIFITEPLENQEISYNDDCSSDDEWFGVDNGFEADVNDQQSDSKANNDSSAIVTGVRRKRTTENNTDEVARKIRKESVEHEFTDEDSSSSSSTDPDPDFDPELEEGNKKDSNSESKAKKTERKRSIQKIGQNKRCKITYEKSNVILVVRKLKIQAKDADVWVKRERNSEFFRNLENKCELCVARLSPNESLQNHLVTLHKETPTSHTCTICKIVFKSLDKLKSHLDLHNFVLRCGLCGYMCYGKHNMLDHLDRHRRTIECVECGDQFRFAKDFDAHYKLNHSSFKCDICSKKFSKKERLLMHVDNNHTSKNCSLCNKTFVNGVKLTAHMKYKHEMDRSEENFCVACGIQLDNRAQFKYHLYTSPNHASERNTPLRPKVRVQCDACPSTFCSRDAMRRHHKKVHLRMKEFCCPYCDKDFRAGNVLRDHIKYVHEGVPRPRNHICHICARGFNVRKTLVHHVLTHTGEKPHQCPHCDARFAQRTAMRTHVRNRHR